MPQKPGICIREGKSGEMKRKKNLAAVIFAATLAIMASGCSCSLHAQKETARHEYTENDSRKGEKENTDQNVAETAGLTDITVFDIKKKYGTDKNMEIAPFYNVGQDTVFALHFNSAVDPVSAVTVHTDAKCGTDSMVYQINDGYRTENKTDVFVNPGNPVLSAEKEKCCWGNAPIYYLCIHYDMQSSSIQRLENPYIVPFTVKSPVSIPNAEAYVNSCGQFEIQWNPVDEAVSYNIYEAAAVKEESDAGNMSRSECAYIGDHPKKIASVDNSCTSFKDFHCDNTDNTLISESGYVIQENFHNLGTYYITAVDSKGNESAFSMAMEGWKHNKNLPKSFENQSVFEPENGYASVLPETVPVKMADKSTMNLPVSYKKIKEENGSAVYEYTIEGTLLQGTVKYKSEIPYKDEIKSSQKLETAAYKMGSSINIIPKNTVKTKESEYIKLYSIDNFPHTGDRVEYDKDIFYLRADMESARTALNGKYEEGAEPIGIFKKDYAETEEKQIKQPETQKHHKEFGSSDSYKTQHMVFADSAEEEYLAISMADAAEEISVSQFPKLQDAQYLSDAIYKVIYQNPYIIGVSSFGYDADKELLCISYTLDRNKIKQQQNEIEAKAEKIISSIISENMDEEEKILAVWDYLEKNAVYDYNACSAASENSFADIKGYEDSFSAYGILCKKTGVCQSYMHAFKLLSEMAGVECRSLTGYIQNNMPHGWNAVKINGKWYWMDATNSMTNAKIPYFIYQTSKEFAQESWNYVLDKDYALDNELSFADTGSIQKDWYYEKGLFAESHDGILNIISKKLKESNGTLYIKCTFKPCIDDQSFITGLYKTLEDCGYSSQEIAATQVGAAGQIMIIDTNHSAL